MAANVETQPMHRLNNPVIMTRVPGPSCSLVLESSPALASTDQADGGCSRPRLGPRMYVSRSKSEAS